MISDFEAGLDQIDLRALGTDFAAVLAAASDDGADVVIDLATLGGSGELRIVNVLEADLGAGDFLL